MKVSFNRDVPWRGVAVVVALALLATFVAGREQASPEVVTAAQKLTVEPQQQAPEPEQLDLGKLARTRRERSATDLFASQAPPAPPVAPPPPIPAVIQPPPAPVAPRLPFAYLGQMKKDDRTLIYLLKNQELLITEPGATLEKDYRVEGVTDAAVHFLYLPLQTKQVLNIPAPQ